MLFWLLFSRSVKNKSKKEYPSFAKELELEEINIEHLLDNYLDSPEEEAEEEIPEVAQPETPTPIEEPAVVTPRIEGIRTTKTKRRRKRKVQKAAFVFNAKDAIIYNAIMTRKY